MGRNSYPTALHLTTCSFSCAAKKILRPSLSTLKILNILKWLLLVFFVIDLMWGPNGISGRYIAMFLDNFSPF